MRFRTLPDTPGPAARRRAGFTLIELLVVVAVIALLAGMLLPVFAQAREKARQAVCISNLKQLAAGMRLYSEDYDEALPLVVGHQASDRLIFPMTWMDRLLPYVGSTSVFVDASSGHEDQNWRRSGDLLANYSFPPSRLAAGIELQEFIADPFGRALWEGLGGFAGPPVGDYRQTAPSRTLAEVARPAETIMLCDHLAFDWGMLSRQIYYPAPRHLREPDLRLSGGRTAPEGLINAAFVDGHVKALKHEQFWTILPGYTHRGGAAQDVFQHFWPYE
jgi:prepilin-type N-terminal cleavage/methylation domain-containing protein/prepilin-type processing-associated H-X9-DG protein